MTFEEAADAVRTLFNAEFPILEPTVKKTTTNKQLSGLALGDSWVQFGVFESFAEKPLLGPRTRQRNVGRLRCRIYTPINTGDDASRRIATSIQSLWDDARANGLSTDISLLETTYTVGNRVAVGERDWWLDITSTRFWYYHDPA